MNEQEKAIQEVFEAIIYQVTTERHKSAALTMISLYAKKGRDLLSSPPAKEPLTDEQLQKETQVLYPTQTNFFGQNIQSQYNELRQEGYIKGRKASEALLKEKENYIQKQQEAINWAAKIMDEKDAEIERLKEAASAPVPYIECEDKEVRERAIDYAAGAGSNRECDIAYNAYLAGEHDGRIAQTKSNYGESATIKELNQQLAELKEENERLKGEIESVTKSMKYYRTELENLQRSTPKKLGK